ncbi:glycosyltransferase [uncultured Gemmiger sp.]|uniref:glycosyltransferase n=1 Tax=uncultured Gemmiger sp. TaxID=1623490 RepID=UPI0025EC6BFE|nr:glycosyltransferase [uncultured Gemmiger sp.]
MAPIRVLQVMPAMDAGGMETFVMNVYRAIDRTQVQFDFLYHYNKPCFYDDEITALGGQITKLTIRQDNNLPRYRRQLDEFFSAHHYRILHGHYSGFGMFYNAAALRHGVPVRVGHSHNTAYEPGVVGLLDQVMSSQFDRLLTDRFACSRKAGEMLFGKSPFTVLPNGVQVDRFAAPDPAARARLRAQWKVADNAPLLGHVGRFSKQKNHMGLLEIFARVRRQNPAARLVLIGTGALEQQVRGRAQALRLGDSVIFAGVRSDTPDCYAAMDAFLLPSLFEGLPVVLVEAQAAGLPCFVSDRVDPDAAFADGVHFLPLNDPAAWVRAICAGPLTRNPNARQQAVEAGYDVRTSAQKLQQFYIEKFAEVGP